MAIHTGSGACDGAINPVATRPFRAMKGEKHLSNVRENRIRFVQGRLRAGYVFQ